MPSQLTRTSILTSESHSDSAPASTTNYLPFHSILFASGENASRHTDHEAPEYFGDLNLDQVVERSQPDATSTNLKPFFYRPLGVY